MNSFIANFSIALILSQSCFAQNKATTTPSSPAPVTTSTEKAVNVDYHWVSAQPEFNVSNMITEATRSNTEIENCFVQYQNGQSIDLCNIAILEARQRNNDFILNPNNQKIIDYLVSSIRKAILETVSIMTESKSTELSFTVSATSGITKTISINNLIQYFTIVEKSVQNAPNPEEAANTLLAYEASGNLTKHKINLREAMMALDFYNTTARKTRADLPEIEIEKTNVSLKLNVKMPLVIYHNEITLNHVTSNLEQSPDPKLLLKTFPDAALFFQSKTNAQVDEAVWKIIKDQSIAIDGLPLDGANRVNALLKLDTTQQLAMFTFEKKVNGPYHNVMDIKFFAKNTTTSKLNDLLNAREYANSAFSNKDQLYAAQTCANHYGSNNLDVTVYISSLKNYTTVFCINRIKNQISEVYIASWPASPGSFLVKETRGNHFTFYGNSYYFDIGAQPSFTLITGNDGEGQRVFDKVPMIKVEALY